MSTKSRRHFIKILLSLGAGVVFVNDRLPSFLKISEPRDFKLWLEKSGLTIFLRAPSENVTTHFLNANMHKLKSENVFSIEQQSLSKKVFSVMQNQMENLVAHQISEQDAENIETFFSTVEGQKFVQCMAGIPYNEAVNEMAAQVSIRG